MSISDDIARGVLDSASSIEAPSGVSTCLGAGLAGAILTLVTPESANDAWNTNNGARMMQDTADAELQIETRFLSAPTTKYQIRGLLVEQDANNWIRFDTFSDGKNISAYA